MRRWGSFIAVACVVTACSNDPVGPTVPNESSASFAVAGANQETAHIVIFQPNTVNPAAVTGSLEQRHGIRQVRYRYERAVQGFAADLSPAQVRALSADPRVRFVEPDGIMTTNATQVSPPWGLDRINQRNLPLTSSYTYPSTGAGVRFYGIDTGILFSHADFSGRASNGFDAVTPGGTGVDCNGHGTHTASTAAGTTYGVAKGMTIVGVRVLGCNGSGSTSGVIAGVDWVRTNAIKPAVANMSLGGGFSQALNNAVANAVASGVVFSLSAGNSNVSACGSSPASEPSAITVGATTSTDARSSFSNFGTCVDIFGPGSGIVAAYIPSGTASLSGTSMSAPHVAGAAGLYLQQDPTATPAQVATALIGNATNGVITNVGTGSPNKLLYMGFLNGGAVNQPPVAAFTFSCSGLSCTFDGTGSTDDVGVTSYAWDFGDNTTGSGATPSHGYSAAGAYTVTLTVTDAGSLSNATSQSVTVSSGGGNQAPVAVPLVTCVAGRRCTFDGRGSTDDQGVTRYEWREASSGALRSTAATFTRQFNALGSKTWSLTVFDAAGLSDKEIFTFTPLP